MLRRERPEIFHAHLSWPLAAKWALAAAVAARVPGVVATVQLIPEFELERSKRAAAAGALARGRPLHRGFAATSPASWPSASTGRAAKIEVVYNAVELDRFGAASAPALREELAAGASGRWCSPSRRLDEQKGHPVLLARRRRGARTPSSPSPARARSGPRWKRSRRELGIADRVRFLGHRSRHPELLAACDVFALPSLYEGTSLAVLEAMAAGRAVVSSAIGGTDELIEDGETACSSRRATPRRWPPRSAAARRPGLRESWRARARERVERDFTRRRWPTG